MRVFLQVAAPGVALCLIAACGHPPAPPPPPLTQGTVTQRFTATLDAGQELTPCYAWTLNNERPIYVQTLTMTNRGGFHHSNWVVAPDTQYPGPDGFFDCSSRNFDEVSAALQGTVLYAQSTQAQKEVQQFGDGVVVKIPAKQKILAGVHMLNLTPQTLSTEFIMSLTVVHPKLVKTVVTPFAFSYFDLQIPPLSQSWFNSGCDVASAFSSEGFGAFSAKLYWLLPHYHQLGSYFRVTVNGGPDDGKVLHELTGFNADANGKAFDPPYDFSAAKGLNFTCGYLNPRQTSVTWGIGDQEMCVMLGFVDAPQVWTASVNSGTQQTGSTNGVLQFQGPCGVAVLPKSAGQGMPYAAELTAPLYVPASVAGDGGVVPPEVTCSDATPSAVAAPPATLSSIRSSIFAPSCAFSSCHGGPNPQAGLYLAADTTRASLLSHAVQAASPLPLVAPGHPDGSWLYQRLSKCSPVNSSGQSVTHMPRNGPALLEDSLVAKVRDWIAQGALDN